MSTTHIGIVGCTAEGASLCYRTICQEGEGLLGPHGHPEITMHTFSLADYIGWIDQGNWRAVANLMSVSAAKVAAAGADFIICPDNTIHEAFEWVIPARPWMHIVDVVAAEAARRRYKKVAVLGTRYLMEGAVYRTVLHAWHIEHAIPGPEERAMIHRLIFDELIPGRVSNHSRAQLLRLIERIKDRGCDAVVLGCTELPLLISDQDAGLPLLDSTRLLARAALMRAVGSHHAVA
jgi:aspartate racemase